MRIGFQGSGTVALETIFCLFREFKKDNKHTINWYSHSLSNSGYGPVLDRLGIRRYNWFECHYDLETMINESDIVVLASSSPLKSPKVGNRNIDRRDMTDLLFSAAQFKLDTALNKIGKIADRGQSPPLTIIVSNPPSVWAYRGAHKFNIPYNKIAFSSPDNDRAKQLIVENFDIGYEHIRGYFLAGTHQDPIFITSLGFIGNDKASEVIGEEARRKLETELRGFGDRVMKSHKKAKREGRNSTYKDAASALADGLIDLINNRPADYFGVYDKKLGGFFLSPQVTSHQGRLEVLPEKREQYHQAIRRHSKRMTKLTRQQHIMTKASYRGEPEIAKLVRLMYIYRENENPESFREIKRTFKGAKRFSSLTPEQLSEIEETVNVLDNSFYISDIPWKERAAKVLSKYEE